MRSATSASRRRRLAWSREVTSSMQTSGNADPNCASTDGSRWVAMIDDVLNRTSPLGRRSCPRARVWAPSASGSMARAACSISCPAVVSV